MEKSVAYIVLAVVAIGAIGLVFSNGGITGASSYDDDNAKGKCRGELNVYAEATMRGMDEFPSDITINVFRELGEDNIKLVRSATKVVPDFVPDDVYRMYVFEFSGLKCGKYAVQVDPGNDKTEYEFCSKLEKDLYIGDSHKSVGFKLSTCTQQPLIDFKWCCPDLGDCAAPSFDVGCDMLSATDIINDPTANCADWFGYVEC